MRNKPRALPINPSDLVVDSPQQAETVYSRCFTLALELAEASVQAIKFGPFKIIHLHHLSNPRIGLSPGRPGGPAGSEVVARRSGWEDSDNQDENSGVAAHA